MLKKINNNSGIALMMVLILLILVGGLTAALMSAGVFNIRFGGDEVERTQAFYAADAGVEYTRNWLREEGLNIIIDSDDPESINVIDSEEEFQEDHYFDIEVEYNNDKITFISTGRIHDRIEDKIKFSYDINPGESLENIAYFGAGDGEVSDHVEFKGTQDELTEENMHITQELGSWYEFLSKTKDEFGELSEASQVNPDQIGYKTFGRYEVSPDEDPPDFDNPENPPNDFNAFAVELGDDGNWPDPIYYEDENNSENNYYYPYYKKTDGDNNIVGTGYPYGGDLEELTEEERETIGLDNEDNLSFQLESEKSKYNTKNDVEGLSDSHMFFSTEELLLDFDLDIGGGGQAKISDSILIVDGSFNTTGGLHLENTLILVRDKAEFGGALNLDGSMIVTFNQLSDESEAMVVGSPSVEFTAQSDYTRWSGIQQILDSGGTPSFSYNNDWRQVR